MNNLKTLTALTALNNMLAKGFFDICTVNNVAKMLEVDPLGEAHTILQTLHCIHFNTMPAELRNAIPRLVQECLGVAPIFQFENLERPVIENCMPPKKPGLLQLLNLKR